MKTTSKLALFFVTVILSFTAISCKNFMNGKELAKELEEVIRDNNNERPVAKIISPVYSLTGDYRNASIVINFSKPIDTKTFDIGFSITDDANKSLKEYYSSPEWNNNFTQVIIPANKKNLLNIPENTLFNIKISLKDDIKDSNGISLVETLNESYVLNSIIDDDIPILIETKMAKTINDLEKNENLLLEGDIREIIKNKDGTYDDNNTFIKNHIKDKVSLYIEGSDLTKTFAYIEYKRIYKTDGTQVNEPTETKIIELTDIISESKNKCKTFDFDISDSKYIDGLYEIKIYLKDNSANISSEVKTYYIVRDTTLTFNNLAGLNTPFPAMRNVDVEETSTVTLKEINELNKSITLIQYQNNGTDNIDTYMKYKNYSFSTSISELIFSLSCGTGPDNIVIKTKPEHFSVTTGIIYFNYPEEILNYIDTHNDTENIYIQLTATDLVGNEAMLYTYLPRKNYLFDYTIDETGKLTLNFDDKGGFDVSNELSISDSTVAAVTRVFYAEIDQTKTLEELPLKRNFLYEDTGNYYYDNTEKKLKLLPNIEENSEPPVVPSWKKYRYTTEKEDNPYWWSTDIKDNDVTITYWNNDPWDGFPDPGFIQLTKDTDYLVVIQTSYATQAFNYWTGTALGKPCIIRINGSSSNSGNSNPFNGTTFDIIDTRKELCEKNSGLTKIFAKPSFSKKPDVEKINYSFGISTDVNGPWTYYNAIDSGKDTFYFETNTPITPPNTSEEWKNKTESDYCNEGDHDISKHVIDDNYDVTLYVKCIAYSDGYSISSDTKEIIFNRNDDNIAPEISSWTYSHDLTISADGTYFYTSNSLIQDSSWNDPDEFTYYYTPYLPGWENNVDPLSESEIKSLPSVTTTLYHNCWKTSSSIERSNVFNIPVNGLADGDYMYFVTVTDKCGNSSTGGMGKVHIGTFKNKLIPSYNLANGKLSAKLELSSDETPFTNNQIFVRYFNNDKHEWKSFNRSHDLYYEENSYSAPIIYESAETWNREMSYFASNYMILNGSTLTFETGDQDNYSVLARSNIKNDFQKHPEKDNSDLRSYEYPQNFPEVLPKGCFYKLVATSYNILEYFTNPKFNKANTNEPIFSFDIDGNHIFDHYDSQNPYDVYTDETASYPAYIYIPESSENIDNCRHTFDKNNARIASNKKVLVNIITSIIDLGDNIDEWERRGSLAFSNVYEPNGNNKIDFDYTREATSAILNSGVLDSCFYVITAHFVDGETGISRVFTTY